MERVQLYPPVLWSTKMSLREVLLEGYLLEKFERVPINKTKVIFRRKRVRPCLTFIPQSLSPVVLKVLIVINILGSVYGYYWYSGQLEATRFTCGCLLLTALFNYSFALALTGILLGYNNRLLQLVAYTGVIKFGIWAAVVILDFWVAGGTRQLLSPALSVPPGNGPGGWVYIRHLYVPPGYLILLALWFGVGDFLDYFVGIHPYLYYPGQFTVAAVTAVLLSIVLLLYVWIWRVSRHRFIFGK